MPPRRFEPCLAHLSRGGSLLAAAWYTLCGAEVAWPLEPSRYDLVVHFGGDTRRVQVKTTTVRAGDSWKAYLSVTRRQRRLYEPSEVDDFFVVDGALNYYVIPIAVVRGKHAIHLSAYTRYRVGSAGDQPVAVAAP
ncbi:group I intron-associated PD-(D/E)XK endonuclease [Gordonia sp. (in: high G+C Gram-positive bacteria)]|uniref:group I intron-associated PD-(D/E)XK endonuclease n=1 Tax=Gordonia sp. (in: high G+C Gram-positive bacteria) TaxID=84139 RepID=UPI0039E5E281